MRNFKKKFSVFAALALICSFVFGMVPVHAQETAGNIQPRAATCGDCNQGVMVITDYGNWGPWVNYGDQDCVHGYAYGYDMIKTRTRTITYQCTNCGRGFDSTQTERQVICRGSND